MSSTTVPLQLKNGTRVHSVYDATGLCAHGANAKLKKVVRLPRTPRYADCRVPSGLDSHAVAGMHRMTLERIVHPLDGTLFAFVNVPQQWSQTRIVQTEPDCDTCALHGVRLAISEVVNNVPNSPYRGMAQYHGLQRCWAVAAQTALYETIIRVRTDAYHGLFPRVLVNIKHSNIIYADGLRSRVQQPRDHQQREAARTR